MNLKLKEIVFGAFVAISPIIGSAQVNDGVYAGTLQCGPLLTNPAQGPWTQTIHLTVNANNLSWERSSPTFSESGNSSIQAGRVSINANGVWNASARNTGGWKTVAMLNLEGEKLVGPATIFSENGVQRLRDCTASVMVSSQSSSASLRHRSQTHSNNLSSSSNERRGEKALKNLDAQVNKILAPSTDNTSSRTVVQSTPPNKGQQTNSQIVAPTIAPEVPASRSAIEGSKRPTYSTALQKITPDMCVDNVCVEQDIEAMLPNLNWVFVSNTKSIRNVESLPQTRKQIESCADSNKALWGNKADELCRIMRLAEYLPPTEILSFFKENKNAVCSSIMVNVLRYEISTQLGLVYVYISLGKDGRPKVKEIVKHFNVLNKEDLPEIRSQLEKKHPYMYAPWGGTFDYSEYGRGRGPIYSLRARDRIFIEGHQQPNEAACTPARKTINVQ